MHQPRGTPARSRRARWRFGALVLVHVAVLAHLAHWKLAGQTLSPLEPSEAGETLELGYVNAGFVLLLVTLAATLVLGRFFCGWACHVVALQDLCQWLLAKVGLRPRPVRSRLLVWVPLIAAYRMFVHPSLARIAANHEAPALSNHLLTEDMWARMPGWLEGGATLLVCGFIVVWVMGAKGFCTYGCPYGALYGLADRLAKGRIRVTDACEGCGHCTATCTSGVRVHEEVALHRQVVDSGCMKCMDCVSVCPKDALYFGFKARSKRAPKPRASAPRRYDFNWGEEVLLAAVMAATLYGLNGFFEHRPAPFRLPFLLSLGLGTLAAAAALALVRLTRRRDQAWQHLVLRRAGRVTATGWASAAVAAAFLLCVAQQGAANTLEHRGWVAFEAGRATPPTTSGAHAERSARFEESRALLSRARLVRLTGSARLEHGLGVLARALGDMPGSEEHLRRALALDPADAASRLALADLLLLRNDAGGAFAELEELRRLDPASNEALTRLGSILQVLPDFGPARLAAAEILFELGDLSGAANVLVPLLATEPPDPAARALLDRVEAAAGG